MSSDINTPQNGMVKDVELKSSMRKVAITALAGTSIEWYDFFLYATAAALGFPSVFFPEYSPTILEIVLDASAHSSLP